MADPGFPRGGDNPEAGSWRQPIIKPNSPPKKEIKLDPEGRVQIFIM